MDFEQKLFQLPRPIEFFLIRLILWLFCDVKPGRTVEENKQIDVIIICKLLNMGKIEILSFSVDYRAL